MAEAALERLRRHAQMAEALADQRLADQLEQVAAELAERFRAGGTLLVFGNGGSAADAQHVAAEFTGRYLLERPPLPALALSDNGSAVSAIGNDYGFEQVFARQVAALAGSGGAAIGLSTSGRSANVLEALRTAAGAGMLTIAVTGSGGTGMGDLCDHLVVIPSDQTPHIQEGTMLVLHVICELVEQRLFGA
jgi:D-sedoheptulose 7-phosphate isomerase